MVVGTAVGLILIKGGSSGSAQTTCRLLPNQRLILTMGTDYPTGAIYTFPGSLLTLFSRFGSIRYYFPNKDELVASALWRVGERVDDRIRRRTAEGMTALEFKDVVRHGAHPSLTRFPHQPSSQGLMSSIPVSSKSAVLRVASMAPRSRQMAAI